MKIMLPPSYLPVSHTMLFRSAWHDVLICVTWCLDVCDTKLVGMTPRDRLEERHTHAHTRTDREIHTDIQTHTDGRMDRQSRTPAWLNTFAHARRQGSFVVKFAKISSPCVAMCGAFCCSVRCNACCSVRCNALQCVLQRVLQRVLRRGHWHTFATVSSLLNLLFANYLPNLLHVRTHKLSTQFDICNSSQIWLFRKSRLEQTAPHCNTLPHTATHCNT